MSSIQNRNVNAAGAGRGGAVEDDVVAPRERPDRSGREHRVAELGEVGVEVRGQRGVAGEAVLVPAGDDPRLDRDALVAAE